MNGQRNKEDEGRRERAGDFEWVRDFNCIGLPWKKKERDSCGTLIKFIFYFYYLSWHFFFKLNFKWHVTSNIFNIKKKTISHISIFHPTLNSKGPFFVEGPF